MNLIEYLNSEEKILLVDISLIPNNISEEEFIEIINKLKIIPKLPDLK